jgi:hypothetical protein
VESRSSIARHDPGRPRASLIRAFAAGIVALALPLIVACGAGTSPPARAVPVVVTTLPTPTPTAIPTAGPAIGDTCLVGTWKLVKGTLDITLQRPRGAVTVAVTGGAGEREHLYADGTYLNDEAGAPFVGSAHGIRVVVRPRGQLRSPVIFLNGNETLEPIDTSRDHTTVALNGGLPKPIPEVQYQSYSYTCQGNAFSASDGYGDRYVYQRVSTTP